MRQFLTIHQRVPIGQNLTEFDNCIWVNEKTPHWEHEIKKYDRVFVYEAAKLEHGDYVEVNGRLEKAQDARQGLVSCFTVTSDFIREDYGTYEGNIYVGKFQGDYISRRFIPLRNIKEAWLRTFGKNFIPLRKGGIIELNAEECRLLSSLMGVAYP